MAQMGLARTGRNQQRNSNHKLRGHAQRMTISVELEFLRINGRAGGMAVKNRRKKMSAVGKGGGEPLPGMPPTSED